MQKEPVNGAERLTWIEPTVESLDLRATESNWGNSGNDGFPSATDSAPVS